MDPGEFVSLTLLMYDGSSCRLVLPLSDPPTRGPSSLLDLLSLR